MLRDIVKVIENKDLTDAESRVLLDLVMRGPVVHQPEPLYSASVVDLATSTRRTTRSVMRVIKTMEDAGVIKRLVNQAADGKREVNYYRLLK